RGAPATAASGTAAGRRCRPAFAGSPRVALYRWLLRLVGDEALAEDLLSNVFSRRLAPRREVRGALIGFYLAIGDRAPQGNVRAAPPHQRPARRRDQGRNSRSAALIGR